MSPNSQTIIPVKAKLANRFYEPMILLFALNQAFKHNQPPRAPDSTPDVAQSVEYDFHRFVDKLAQLCHTTKGPDSITAFVVLKFPDHIQYRFASNQQKEHELIRVQSFITSILESLAEASEHTLKGMVSPILRKVLSFTRLRVQVFVSALKTETVNCIKACKREKTKDCK
jgi:hypothetical protein